MTLAQPCTWCERMPTKQLATLINAHGGTWMCPACTVVFDHSHVDVGE